MSNFSGIEDAIYTSCHKAVQEIILEQVSSKRELIAFIAREALDDDTLKQWVKNFINYDDKFRDYIQECCVEALTERLDVMISAIKVSQPEEAPLKNLS